MMQHDSLMPIPLDAVHLGTIDQVDYYCYAGAIWARTATGWRGVCLIEQWPTRPEAQALAAQQKT